jgi:hypothetical protein
MQIEERQASSKRQANIVDAPRGCGDSNNFKNSKVERLLCFDCRVALLFALGHVLFDFTVLKFSQHGTQHQTD